jgi:uncharacterized DUF497 family protein
MDGSFEWDEEKNQENQDKHGVPFEEAQLAFNDPYRLIFEDTFHSIDEDRFYCIGLIAKGIVTVRYTYRGDNIRIFGAGYWRRFRRMYQEENKHL